MNLAYLSIFRSAVTFMVVALMPLLVFAAGESSTVPHEDGLHGRPWAFGQSDSRKDAIWKKGITAGRISRINSSNKDAANTSAAIDRALSETEKRNLKGSLGMSVADESSAFKSTPEAMHPDENIYRDRRHVVRAFADVKAGDDLNISVGPELILKDEQHVEENANESQPGSAFGLGMKFKYDF